MKSTHCDSPYSGGQAGPHHPDAQDDGFGSGHGRVWRRDQDTQTQLKHTNNTSLMKSAAHSKRYLCWSFAREFCWRTWGETCCINCTETTSPNNTSTSSPEMNGTCTNAPLVFWCSTQHLTQPEKLALLFLSSHNKSSHSQKVQTSSLEAVQILCGTCELFLWGCMK